MKKIFYIFFCLAIIASCGKKSGLNYPEQQGKPDFSKIIDE